MGTYLLRRVLLLGPMVWLVGTVVFLVLRVVPGDAAVAMLGDDATPEAIAQLRARAGLDKPLMVQYGDWIWGLARGDMGKSVVNQRPVASLYWKVLPHTLLLLASGTVIAVVVGVVPGVIAAAKPKGALDNLINAIGTIFIGFPSFFLGFLFLLLFSLHLGWLPSIGAGSFDKPGSVLQRLVLPAFTIGLVEAGRIARITRTSMFDVLSSDYIRTARAKGLGNERVLFYHALKNAALPLLNVLGVYVAALAGGTIIIETVFARPGVGRLLVGGILARDITVVQSGVLIFAVSVVVINTIVDLMSAALDPRIRLR